MPKLDRRTFMAGAGGAALAMGAPSIVKAQSAWPNRPVRLIVPLAPGGAIDFVARQCGQIMSQTLGQQVYVENHTGAGGSLGMDLAKNSAPDGYTFLITNDNAASAPHILKLPYDYTQVLVPVIDIAHQPQVLGTHPSMNVSSVKEYVAYAKANPGLGFASSGVGSNQHVVGLWFAREAGIKLDHVPYRGAGQAVGDLLAGHVKSAFLGPTALIGHHLAGKIKIIAQTSGKRAPTLQDIPTIDETYKGLILEAWYAAFAPPGTPPELVQKMNEAFKKAMADKTLQDNFTKGSLELVGGTPEQLGTLAKADSVKYAKLVKELGISAGPG